MTSKLAKYRKRDMNIKSIGAIALLSFISCNTNAAPVIYTDKALYLSDLASLGYSSISESFEDSVVWADSRNSVVNPGSTPSVTSQGIVWTSNYPQNNIATGDVGGTAPDGLFAIYSLPHGITDDSGLYCDTAEDPIPVECYQNDGLKVQAETGELLYAFGGRIDTANAGKVSFLLDGVDINGNDTDNIDNWQREGVLADNWTFVGVIDTDGFLSAELRELKGKDVQQVFLFSDDFTIGVTNVPADVDGDGIVDHADNCTIVSNPSQRDTDNDGFGNYCDPDFDNDLIVNAADLAYFKPQFFSTDPDADLNGNGIVNAADLAILKTMFFKPPGPSGLVP